MAIGFGGLENGNNSGTLWVDDISLSGQITAADTGESEPEGEDEAENGEKGGLALPCTGGVVFPLIFFGIITAIKAVKQK